MLNLFVCLVRVYSCSLVAEIVLFREYPYDPCPLWSVNLFLIELCPVNRYLYHGFEPERRRLVSVKLKLNTDGARG